jgi:hypothetical protein
MPYFRNKEVNLLYIHIPKTGGTSLEKYFSCKFKIKLDTKSLFMFLDKESAKRLNIQSSLQHITYETIKKHAKELGVDFKNIKVITSVRNPYERAVSDLFHFKLISKTTSKEDVFAALTKFIKLPFDNHSLPQYVFVTDSNTRLIPGIHILRTESLTRDMHSLGYTDFNIHNNVTKGKENIKYYDLLNNDSIELINRIYDEDFRIFGYKKIETNEIYKYRPSWLYKKQG